MTQETRASSFDELAKGLASGTISRRKALRLMGAALFGAALVPLLPEQAQALTNKQRRRCHTEGGTVCSSGTRASEVCCPRGTTCVNGTCSSSASGAKCNVYNPNTYPVYDTVTCESGTLCCPEVGCYDPNAGQACCSGDGFPYIGQKGIDC